MKHRSLKIRLFLFIRKLHRRSVSITMKLFLSFTFILTCMILLSYINFSLYKNDRESITRINVARITSQTVTKIDQYFMNQRSYTRLPLFNSQIDYHFFSEYDNFNKDRTPSILLKTYTDLVESRIIDANPSTHSIVFFNLKGDSMGYLNGGSFTTNYNAMHEAWFKRAIASNGKSINLGTYLLKGVAPYYSKSTYVFATARALFDTNTLNLVGVMLINNKISYLANLCKQAITVPKQRILIIDNVGQVIYDMKEANITKMVEPSIMKCVTKSSNGSAYLKMNGIRYLIRFDTSEETNWKVVNLIPINELNRSINNMRMSTTAVTILLISLTLAFILLISRQIVLPIKKLSQLMKIVVKGDFSVKIDIKSKDEIGQLANSFNNMTNQINKLINEILKDKVERKELELQMLQYQINPHFLYNTLESIQMMALINEDEQTSDMAYALGKILRYGISKNHEIVTVREELSNLTDYVMLQKVRFEDIFDIDIDIDPQLDDYKIIKLILQPIVENSIYHGLKDTPSGGMIKILGYAKDENILFQVIDNGMGMEPEKVVELNEYINELNDSFTSIGLKNINKRIKLRYGDFYGIQVTSQVNVGCTVTVVLPIQN